MVIHSHHANADHNVDNAHPRKLGPQGKQRVAATIRCE